MIGRFLKLPAQDRALLISAGLLVSSIRAALWVLPYRIVRQRLNRRRGISVNACTCSRIAWAISTVSRYIPGATCLTQALAGEVLLRTYGHEPSLHIGVAKINSRALEAHAWIEVQGKIILGDAGTERFTPLRAPGGAV
jgi:hypothetical protein